MAHEPLYSWEGPRRAIPTGSLPSSVGRTRWPPVPSHGDFCSTQSIWRPYWVHCKFHGWQQCPACSSEIAISQLPPCDLSGSPPPRKRPRCPQDDDLQIDQIVSFVSTLSMEQISTTASVLLEHYIRSSETVATPHAEDVVGLHVILSLMNKLAVQPHEASSSRQTYSSNDICLSSASTPVANQVCDKSLETALPPRPSDDHGCAVACQFPRVVRKVPSVDIDVDV